MPLLQVRECPEDLYRKITVRARRENRTIAQQVVVLLERGLGQEQSNRERRRTLLERIGTREAPAGVEAIDDVALIHEGRERCPSPRRERGGPDPPPEGEAWSLCRALGVGLLGDRPGPLRRGIDQRTLEIPQGGNPRPRGMPGRVQDGSEPVDDYFGSVELWKEALAESIRQEHSACDMFNAVLARRNDATLLTNDARLRATCAELRVECFG